MLVSIILPAFNRERFLDEAIQSVFSQTYPHWELIVVDDGSTDSTAAIARRYADENPGAVRLISKRNGGVVSARNAGIQASRGEFVAFIDSDDRWDSSKLALQVDSLSAYPPASFVYTGHHIVDSTGTLQRTVLPDPRFQGHIEKLLWLEHNEILGPTMIVRRDALFSVGLFDERLRGAENLDLRIKLARRGPVHYVNAPLYFYRKHDESLTAQVDLMVAQHWRMIQAHFAPGEPAAKIPGLRRQVIARHWRQRADLAFIRNEFGLALRCYCRSLPASSRKINALVLALRCVLGRPGNALLRRLKAVIMDAPLRD